jgi:hypothetical protein
MLLARPRPPLRPVLRARLVAHREIACQNWRAVLGLGAAALPALEVAVRDHDPVIRREARWAMYRVLERHARAPRRRRAAS